MHQNLMFCCKKFELGIDGTSPIQRLTVFKARVSSHEQNKQNHRRCIGTAVAAFAVPDDTVYTIYEYVELDEQWPNADQPHNGESLTATCCLMSFYTNRALY